MSTKDANTGKTLVTLVNHPLTRRNLIRGALRAGFGFFGVGCFNGDSGNNTEHAGIDGRNPAVGTGCGSAYSPGYGYAPKTGSSAAANSGDTTSSNPRDGAGTKEAGKSKEHLAAVCGTYCGACPSYIAKHSEDEQIRISHPWGDCDGCLSGGMLAAHCQSCNIRLCAANKENVARCSNCEELPCHRITNLINTGGYPHRKEYLPNLEKIREMGVREWIKCEEERWRCPRCRLPMSWYDTNCARCGEPRSERLFPLKKSRSHHQ
ncbi:MAG: DUF3795 domain-containing protein [Vicinamibacteria bacterium]|nr:DUF3795 domain-containing protein [Vicinamibacteria bacterium]